MSGVNNAAKSRITKKQIDRMKKSTLLLVVAAAALITGVTRVSAGEPVLSPRAKANQIRVAAGSSAAVNLATHRPIGNAKAWAHAQSLQKVTRTGAKVDLAHGPRPALSPKDPRFEQVARELRNAKFQVAPLK